LHPPLHLPFTQPNGAFNTYIEQISFYTNATCMNDSFLLEVVTPR
jgi:hypothetical protein